MGLYDVLPDNSERAESNSIYAELAGPHAARALLAVPVLGAFRVGPATRTGPSLVPLLNGMAYHCASANIATQ